MNNETNKDGYVQIKIIIRDLYSSGETNEPSEKALRARAKEGILSFIESIGNTYYYDKMLSIIRVLAARKCKQPGIMWSDIGRVFKKNESLDQTLIERMNQGDSSQDLVKDLAQLLLDEIHSEG